METILILLAIDSSFPSSSLISKIPSTMELTALVNEFGDVRLPVNVKIAVASNSLRSKESSPTNFRTALSPKSTKNCVKESTTTRMDMPLLDDDDDDDDDDKSLFLLFLAILRVSIRKYGLMNFEDLLSATASNFGNKDLNFFSDILGLI